MKAMLIIDDIDERWFKYNLSCTFRLLYYPNGEMKELGICGKHHLIPIPNKREFDTSKLKRWLVFNDAKEFYKFGHVVGWNDCIHELVGEEHNFPVGDWRRIDGTNDL